MGMLFLSVAGTGMLLVDQSVAQSIIDGSWTLNSSGSWGTVGNWSYRHSMRAASMSVNLNAGPLVTVFRKNDKVESVVLQALPGAGGSGYTVPPTVIMSDPGANGRPAVVKANISGGSITSFTVVDPGSGYTGTPTATVTREVSSLQVIDPGSGYAKAPLIEFSGGGGFTSPPTVTFRGGLGAGAEATATVTSGAISAITINNGGQGYSSARPPTVSFVSTNGGSGAAATVQLGISPSTFTINSGTTTYSAPPTVTVIRGNGTTSDAVATAVLDGNGLVTGINITNPGTGFTGSLPPTITFTGGTVITPGINPTGTGRADAFVVSRLDRTNNGSGYSNLVANAPSIVFTMPTPLDVAVGTAVVEEGRVVAVEINDGGTGYTTPPLVIFSGGGVVGNGGTYAEATLSADTVGLVSILPAHSEVPAGGGAGGAIAVSNFSSDPEIAKMGAIDSVSIMNGGQGFTSVPTVLIGTTPRRNATATSAISGTATVVGGEVVGGAVTQISVGNPGSGYLSAPSVSISTSRWLGYTGAPRVRFVADGVTSAMATANRNATTGEITGFSIQDGGLGYSDASPPTVTIVGGNGTGASASAAISLVNGQVTAVNVTNQGSDYGVAPRIVFSGGGGSGAAATAVLAGKRVTAITVTNPGSGYTSAPVVTIIPGDVANPATATATVVNGRVTALTLGSGGSGYTSVPTVLFTHNGITHGTATATVSAGRLTRITVTNPGNGYTTAPTISLAGGMLAAGVQGTATATVSAGKINEAVVINTRGGADPASATATLAEDGSVGSISVVNAGNGYLSAPLITLSAPTGIDTPVMLAPGGVGSHVQFNRDITGNFTITLEDQRVVGSLMIGDTGAEDYVLASGTGGRLSSLAFSMGDIGAGKSFLTKIQGDQDVISAPIVLNDELNARINNGRLTISGGITGIGSLTSSGNSVMTVVGNAPASNLVDLWVWNRSTANAGAQVELGVRGGPGFDDIRLGNASMGTGGHAVLQLQENRGSNATTRPFFLDQIKDNARIVVDAVTNRWGYFKLMGWDETIGSILDVGNALVLENMEGETINTDAVLTLGGDNLDSYIGGFIRNRAGGSGSGVLGLTKNGTGRLTLSGGNINYTGATTLNEGVLQLINTTNFSSRVIAADGTRIEVETTTGVNFDDDVIGSAEFRKLGTSTLNFNSGQVSVEDFFMTAGTTQFLPGASTLRGGENTIRGSLTVLGDGGRDKTVRIADSLSVGEVNAEGRFGQQGSFLVVQGTRLSNSSRGYYRDAVLESAGGINVTNMNLQIRPTAITDNRTVTLGTPAGTGGTTIGLNDVNNLMVGAIITLGDGFTPENNLRNIPQETRIVSINLAARSVTLDKVVKIQAGTDVVFTYSSNTDGAVRGESLNFADVVYDGRKFVAVTAKGSIHTSVDGSIWTQVYQDPLRVPFESLAWTGERLVAVGHNGRVMTSTDASVWVAQTSGVSTHLRSITSTAINFTGTLTAGSPTIANVTDATSFLAGMPVVAYATAPDARIISTSIVGSNVSIVMDGPALSEGTNVDFGYFTGRTTTTGTGAVPRTITEVHTAQHVPLGIVLTTSVPNAIPAGTTVTDRSGPNSTITLSAPATTSQAGVDLFTLAGTTTSGSNLITGLTNTSGLFPGMVIKGSVIPAGARIVSIDTGANSLTLSVRVPTSRANVALSVFTGRLVNTSPVVQDVTSATSFAPGMVVRGQLFPQGARVVSTTADSVTLNVAATASSPTSPAADSTLSVFKRRLILSGTFAAGNTTVTGIADTSGLVQGMPISAPGVIPGNTLISDVTPGSITLSQAATTHAVAEFSAGFDLVAVGDEGRIMASSGGLTDTWTSLNSPVAEPNPVIRRLNSISWSGTRLVAVGENGEIVRSQTGRTWIRQAPPLATAENVILATDDTTITLNNNAVQTATNVSFAGVKGNVTDGSPTVTSVTGIHALRPGLQIFSTSGVQAGTSVLSVNVAARSAVLSAPVTATLTGMPIQTFVGLTNNRASVISGVTVEADDDLFTKENHGLESGQGVILSNFVSGPGLKTGFTYYVIRVSPDTFKLAISPADAQFENSLNITSDRSNIVVTPRPNVIREVSYFKGLMVGMRLHGTALSAPSPIIAIDRERRTITIADVPNQSTRAGFGVLYGDVTAGSANVQNIRYGPSIQTFAGAGVHFTAGRAIAPFPDRVGTGVTVSSYSGTQNTITLSSPAIGTGYIPIFSFTGTTVNGSNEITGVAPADFNGLSVGQQIYVTGNADDNESFSTFVITDLDPSGGRIVISFPTNLNINTEPAVVDLAVFTGLLTNGSTLVRNLSNRLGVPAPILYQAELQDVVWSGTQFVAVGSYGAVLTSPDGVAWTSRDSGTGLNLLTVGLSGANLLAAGEDGLILSSANGSTWSQVRSPDHPTIIDARQIRDVNAVIAAGGRTLALGSGGLASTNGTTWSTSFNDSFSGTQNFLTIGGRVGGGGLLWLNNEVSTDATTLPTGGLLMDLNNNNRIDDAMTLRSRGGVFNFDNNAAAGVNFSETIGKLLADQGHFQINTYRASSSGSSTLTFGSLELKPGASLEFFGRDRSSGSVATVLGSIGADARNRVLFTEAPVLDDGIVSGALMIDNEWATYDPVNGLRRLNPQTEYEVGDQPNWTSTDNVRMTAGRALNARRAINSLVMVGQTLNLNNQPFLSIESGGLLVTGTAVIQGNSSNQITSALTRGTARDEEAVLNIINPSQLTLFTEIRDFASTATVAAHAAGSTSIAIPAASMVGLVVGMEVFGAGVPAGARIASIDTGASRIVLNVPLNAPIPANTSWSFAGGPVSLAKSGGGLLVLNGNSNYTGKTYLNNGIVRVTGFGALGVAPLSFVPDQIQLNGGTLQFNHILTNNPVEPDYNLNLNDGLRGITIGIAGGRLEVGVDNPNNEGAGSGAKAPQVNLTITNPINAIGMLELAVRANSSLGQTNSITLGGPGSSNTYRAGIKTEAGFDGQMIIRGNNLIGGLFSEGGNFVLDGNNTFTAPIRSTTGDITITGTNTWNGSGYFEEPIDFTGGTLLLLSPTALGSGGLNLAMGTGARLALAGISQTIRDITSNSNSVIINDDAPDNISTPTPIIFNLDRNQTFAGTIEDGVSIGGTATARLKLIKQGPGTLNLTNGSNDFTGGVEILGGAINISNAGNVDSLSSLGLVTSFDPELLVIDKSVLSFTPSEAQVSNRSFTMGAGPYGATLVANGAIQASTITVGQELRDFITGTAVLSPPVAFRDSGPRTLTLSGTGRGDNTFLLELGDKSASEVTGLFKTGPGTWLLNKSNTYSGLTTVQEGTLVVTKNDALGTKGRTALVNQGAGTFTGDIALPNGTPVTFPLFAATTLPGGLKPDTQYYVVGTSGNSFQVSETPGGSPVALTSAGTNVQFVPKIDSFRSTELDTSTDVFTGLLPNGATVTFNTKIISGVTPALPGGMLSNTPYYVVNSSNGTFQVSQTPGGAPFNFGAAGTAGSLYYTTNAFGNAAAGVNVNGGTLELRKVNYLTSEPLIFEGGALSVPANSTASWAGDLIFNHPTRISVGNGGTLTLNGNLLGSRNVNQEGEGTVVLRGENLAPTTNIGNGFREYAVRAGTLLLDYSLNNASKLVDNTVLRLGGTRRGGTVVLSGGNHEEIVSQLVLEAGASKIYRDSGTSTLRLNGLFRAAGSSLYLDLGRIAKIDTPNVNGMLGAWAIIRDAITNPFWVIPGTTAFSYTVTADASNDFLFTPLVQSHVVRNGMIATFVSTGTLPGGLTAGVPYYIVSSSGSGQRVKVASTFNGPAINLTDNGSGTITMLAELGFQANPVSDTLSTADGHGLANGIRVRVRSYGQLPGGLLPDKDYWVIGAETRGFRLTEDSDGEGPAVDITSSGSGAHVIETQGTERRSGPAALTFEVNPDFAPASDGNNRVRVSIQHAPGNGPITATLTGAGTVGDPYVYTIYTTDDNNSNQAVSAFVAGNEIGGQKIADILNARVTPAAPSGITFPLFTNFPDTGSYGTLAGTLLTGGSYDNGSKELDWARNAGRPGASTNFDDGIIMPTGTGFYSSGWASNANNTILDNVSIGSLASPFSVRFANQVSATVSLLNSGTYSIRSGGILVSPTVAANDSTFTGAGRLTTENQGNLQNFMLHQHNPQGSLIINNRITNRVAVSRTGRLTGQNFRYLSMTVDLTEAQVAAGWTLPLTTFVNTGIRANTRVADVRYNRFVILDTNHDGTLRNQNYVFASPGSVAVSADATLPGGHPARRQITGLSTTADLAPGMTVTGAGITAGTTIEAIVDASTIRLSQENDAVFRAGTYTFTQVPTVINRLGITNDPNRFLITQMTNVSGLSVGMSVSGTGIADGTLVAEVSASPAYIRLDKPHDGIHRTGVAFTFGGSTVRTGTLPVVVTLPGSSSDPNRRILDGVASTQGIVPGVSVTGPGLPGGTTVEVVLDNHTLYLNQYHDGNYRRAAYTFTGGAIPNGSAVRNASVPSSATDNTNRRRVMGVYITGGSGTTVSTNDLYIGMPISGPGIPFGAVIANIYNESDIELNANHFFTAESTTFVLTPTTGIEKLGAGTVVLNGASDYTGVTFIADGTVRAGSLTDGGVPGSLGASSGSSANLVFNGGELQYVGENTQTNRGFTVADFATLNIGHERTKAVFSGVITSGQDSLNKDGPGTLELNGNANLAFMKVEQGRLLLQTTDANPAPGGFSPSNFSQSALTSLILGGGTLELRGAGEGSVTQNFGSQLTVDSGATTVKVTSVPSTDPAALTAPTTRLNIMGQEELTPVIRKSGGSVHFIENPEGLGFADIFLYLPTSDRQRLLPWATYQDTTNINNPGVNHFATVELATTGNATSGGAVVSADAVGLYDPGSIYNTPSGWATNSSITARNSARTLNITEGTLDINNVPIALSGNVSSTRYANILRYSNTSNGTVTIDAGRTLELVGGAILAATSVYQGQKVIDGPGNITGGALNDVNSDFMMHNYNMTTPFTINANIVDRTSLAAHFNGSFGRGTVRTSQTQMNINNNQLPVDFYATVRPGMRVSGPGIQAGTVVDTVEPTYRRIILSLPATGNHTDQVYTFTDTTNFVQVGTGTTVLGGNNTYTGNTYVHGGVLRLNSANAVPGGIGVTGGTSSIIVEGGVVGLGAGDFTRSTGTEASQILFTGNGGFAAYGAERTVNIGGGAVPQTLRFGNNGFVPDGSSLILGSHDATHKLLFANPLDLSAFSQAIRVEDSPIEVEAELTGALSGLGRMIKFGLGTLRLGASNTQSGGIEIAEGRLIAASVADVFGASSGIVRLGTSLTNTSSQAAVELQYEGGTVANPLQVGSVNVRGASWVAGGVVESTQAAANVGEEASSMVVSGFPAIAYYDATNQDLKYVRALDARGSAWGIPVTVASRGNVGRNPSMQIINGNPAISYYDDDSGMLMFVRATDAQGVVWGAPTSILEQSSPTAVAVQADGKILVGGLFTRFDGLTRYRLVRLNLDGSLDTGFNAFVMNGEVRAIHVLPDGKILIGGSFTALRANGSAVTNTTVNRIARLNTDGSLDTSVNPNANGDVRVFVPQGDGKIMVGGSFTTISEVTRTRLARLNANCTLDTSFTNTDIRNGEVRAIIPEDADNDGDPESYAIAGSFTSIRGDGNRNRLARINANATLAAFNPNANNTVMDMVRLPSGKFVVGGAFTLFSDVISRTRLARLNNDGTVDESFAQEVNAEVRDLHLEADGSVLVSGIFTQIGDSVRNFVGRILPSGNVDPAFIPNPDAEVRSLTTMPDGKIVIGGNFTKTGATIQQYAGRLLPTGAADPGIARHILDVGFYSSLYSVNGNPAIAYQNAIGNDVFYIRATDANGTNWPDPELIDSAGDVGFGITLSVANFGGDLIAKDNRGTESTVDDEVTISGTVGFVGVPVIAYGDATNLRLKWAVSNNTNGTGNIGVGLGQAMTNWSVPQPIPGTGNVGRHFSLRVVDGYPAIAYQTSDTRQLRYIRALNPGGITHNLRVPGTGEILRILVSALTFSTSTSWGSPVTLDNTAADVGSFPSLALINGQPTTAKDRPAVSYYDATNGDLKFVRSTDSVGDIWEASQLIVTNSDVGRSSSLIVTDGVPAISYYNATAGDLEFVALNQASGYSRVTLTGNTTWSGPVTLNGSTIFNPTAGTLAQLTGLVSGAAGFRLAGEGTLSLQGNNTFASSLERPGQTTGPGTAVNGGVILRSGTLLAGSSGALGSATVELGDAVPQQISVDRASLGTSVLLGGGYFRSDHDGLTINANGPGAFVGVSATVDGLYLGLTSTTADPGLDRLTGDVADGTALRLFGTTIPTGLQGGLTYYARGSSASTFQVSLTPGGAAVNFNSEGFNLFFIEDDKLSRQILVKDESSHPERNGVYRVSITTDNSQLAAGRINLVRVSAMDSVAEMSFGTRATVSGGTLQGKSYYIGSTVTDVNISAVQWIEDTAAANVALLANAAGITIGNSIDVNAIPGTPASILGAAGTITSGSVAFSGPITLQNRNAAAQDAETLQILSNISGGYGVSFNGTISEAAGQDRLSLMKTGAGVATLTGNNSFQGGINISEGVLLVMNNPSTALPGQSGTGTGTVQIQAGTVLGGLGSVGGPVTMAGIVGSQAVLRPGDPTSSSAPVETLTINAPLTVGAHSVIEFTLGATNYTRLAGTSVNLATATSSILVQLAPGYVPADNTEFQILDIDTLTLFGGNSNLLNLLQLPASKVWDTSQFISSGILKVVGDPQPALITSHPVSATRTKGDTVQFTITYSGTDPVTVQWQRNLVLSGPAVWTDIPGANATTLTLSGLGQADEGQYRARVVNYVNAPDGSISDPANLIVNVPLAFIKDLPAVVNGPTGQSVSLTVIVEGEGPFSYEWRLNGTAIPGAPNDPTFTIASMSAATAGNYTVVVRDQLNNVTGVTSRTCNVKLAPAGVAVVVLSPESRTLLAGSDITLEALPGGDTQQRVTAWRRNGTAIPGEFTNTLIMNGITVAQAGEYTFKVDNRVVSTGKTSTATSDPAFIVVVDNPNRIVAGQVGKSAKMTVVVGTPSKVKPLFRWFKNGVELQENAKFKGVATNTLTINTLALADTDTYTCRVTGAVGTTPVMGGTHFLRVYDSSPEIVKTTPPPAGMVGHFYSWKIPVTSDVAATLGDPSPDAWESTPATYSVRGLPAGLKLDAATGWITGRPTAPSKVATGDSITFTVANAVKPVGATAIAATTWTTTLDINPLPTGIAGVYAGPVERSPTLNNDLGGRFDMTVTSAGAFSGKLILGSDAARSFSGAFNLSFNGIGELTAAPTAVVNLPGTKTSPPVVIAFNLQITPPVNVGEPPVTVLASATISYRNDSVAFSAWRNNFASRALASVSMLPTAYTGGLSAALYNFGMSLATGDSLITNVSVPQGAGYGFFSVSASGGYTLAGRLADGLGLTGSYWVGPTGQIFIYQTLYTTALKGSILGNLQIERGTLPADNDLSGSLTWVRPADVKSRLYKDGFGRTGTPVTTPVPLIAFGGRFVEPSAASTVLGVVTSTGTLEFSEDGDFLPDGADISSATNPNSIDNVTLAAGSKVTVPANAAGTKLSVTHKTGAFSGTFTLVDGAVKRTTPYLGLVIRQRTSLLGVEPRQTKLYGLGYFLLTQPPGTSSSPQRSGMVLFED